MSREIIFRKKILITGANGFLGNALVNFFDQEGLEVIGTSRKLSNNKRIFISPNLEDKNANWTSLLTGVQTLIHCAAHVHVTGQALKEGKAFHTKNVEGTVALARQAVLCGVSRFVYISSIAVNGNKTQRDAAYAEDNIPNPQSAYAISKLQAEQALSVLVKNTSMQLIIIRPPLIYGANAPGNFAVLIKLLRSRIPIPLGGIDNLRSFISLQNLTNFILLCSTSQFKTDELFLVSDNDDVSTTDLCISLREAMYLATPIFKINQTLLRKCISLGKGDSVSSSLLESLRIDSSKARAKLNWEPTSLRSNLNDMFRKGSLIAE